MMNPLSKERLHSQFNIQHQNEVLIALAGNPNVGKSTVFNGLTGLRQHTGNWPGKTVETARGTFTLADDTYTVIDLPGTYSLFSSSDEEKVARDFICFAPNDVVLVLCDATALHRHLFLLLQILEMTPHVVLGINLIDEAHKKNIVINADHLAKTLHIPVMTLNARQKQDIQTLKRFISNALTSRPSTTAFLPQYPEEIESLIASFQPKLTPFLSDIEARWFSLRLIEQNISFLYEIKPFISQDLYEVLLSIYATFNPTDTNNYHELMLTALHETAQRLASESCYQLDHTQLAIERDLKIDRILTSKRFGYPIMIGLLAIILWMTIAGANIPSQLLADLLFGLEPKLEAGLSFLHFPAWSIALLVSGVYKSLAWVISVMLPPMAIFFPLFTCLEDFGYLPRVAFNLDHHFKRACAHGKQCLTMCMGFGCNAAGVIGCRIIDSPREKLIAILTNNFVPCNGRFPTLIAVASVMLLTFLPTQESAFVCALIVTVIVLLGVITTLLVSYLLSKTILKGIPSSFTLELPPYRTPKFGQVIYTSLLDRTLFVLWRAVVIAIPAGAITWIFGNIMIGDLSLLSHAAAFLDPFASAIGLDGFILMAFILGLPANEIVLPILMMAYLSTSSMTEYESLESFGLLLQANGWTVLTCVNVMLFSLLHWPCSTTLLTIKNETGSWKWTAIGFFLPTVIAIVVCFLTTSLYHLVF